VAGAILLALILAAGVSALIAANVYLADAPKIPPRDQLWSIRRSPGMTFLDRTGQVIATRGAKYGQAVTLATLPAYVPKAFLAAEDRRFYQHGPVDVHAILRAISADLRAQRSREGASTITQQLARTLFLKREQTFKRKLQEAYLAMQLEQTLSKDEVLELYMNRTYFGAGAYGLDAASQTYFGKPASQLSLAEAATLAGLPNAPSRLALTNDLPGAVARGHRILQIMRDENWIGDAQLAQALRSDPVLAPTHIGEGDYSYILDQAAAQATQFTGGETPDLVVKTTIDARLQTAAVDAVRSVVLKEGAHRNVSQGALVTLAPDGAIVAMVGGLDHGASAFNRVVQARRQPGSSFKAFVFGAAMEHGLTPTTVRDDAPISYAGWTPENYGHSYAGPVMLEDALARSLNTVSVRLTLEVGPSTVADFARRLGLSDIPTNPGPSIALGAYEVSPLEMAAGYQVFQTGGGRTTPYLVSEVRSTRGEVLYAHADSAPTPVLDPLYATRMIVMLKKVVTSGTGTGAALDRPVAGKTGTSQNWRDAWFVGFTPDYLTAVWVGNDNGQPMAKVTGGELPAQIWKRFMTVAEQGLPARDFPWLVPEPADSGQPDATPVSDTGLYGGPYQDEPAQMSGGADQAAAGPPPADDGSATVDIRQAPPSRWERGAPPPDEAGAPPAYSDAPPQPRQAYGPYDAAPSAPSDSGPPNDQAPPASRGAPDSAADADGRYRY
jgi:penicillin-binding protein 1A